MRQSGFQQNIPSKPINLDEAHKDDMRGITNRNWSQYHKRWITMWNDQHNRAIQGTP